MSVSEIKIIQDWHKPDGTPCTKWEVLRMLAQWRRRNRDVLLVLLPKDANDA